MERCRLVEEGAANWELPLPGFPEGPGLAGGDADGTCAGLNAPPDPPAEPGGALEAELSVLALYPAEPLQHGESAGPHAAPPQVVLGSFSWKLCPFLQPEPLGGAACTSQVLPLPIRGHSRCRRS